MSISTNQVTHALWNHHPLCNTPRRNKCGADVDTLQMLSEDDGDGMLWSYVEGREGVSWISGNLIH